MLACFHPLTGPFLIVTLVMSAVALGIFTIVIRRSRRAGTSKQTFVQTAGIILGVAAISAAMILWLGSYRYSPLEFARGPALTGFQIQKQGGQLLIIPPDGGFSMSTHAYAYIRVIANPPISDCYWHSAAGASMDSNSTCDIVYAPPPAELDVLRVSGQIACGLPSVNGQLKIAILP